MTDFATEVAARLRAAFEPARNATAAVSMAAYMRNLFPFLGISTVNRRSLEREALAGMPKPSEEDLGRVTSLLWALDEREYQYTAEGILARHIGVCSPAFLPNLRELVTTKSWWDTVDALASHCAGPLVLAHPELATEMDSWARDENAWVARTAILHQLGFKRRTNPERLFAYCAQRATDRDFFIRKAIGWALREYSKTDAVAVRAFVDAHRSQLSPLSQREALLWLNGGRKARNAPPG